MVSVDRAVNLVQLMSIARTPQHLPLFLLLRGVVTETTVSTLDNMGHTALLVRDDVSEERWRAIVRVVRLKFPRWEFPLYEKVGGWRYVRDVEMGR